MKKLLLKFTFSTITYFLLLSPFLLPDEWTYIKHCKSEFHPTTDVLMSISIFIVAILAYNSIYRFYNNLFDNLEE
jgi:hypothetical protein